MKATYNGVSMEGTPKEIAECKRLIDEQHAKPTNPYQPYPYQPYWMSQPWTAARYYGDTYTTGTVTGTIKTGGNSTLGYVTNIPNGAKATLAGNTKVPNGTWIDNGFQYTTTVSE